MRVPGRYAVVEVATGLIAADVRDSPFKADDLAAAKALATKGQCGPDETPDDVLADMGVEVVPLSHGLELAYKAVKPAPVKVTFSKGAVFRRVTELVHQAEGDFDAVLLSMRSHDDGGRYCQLSTTLPRLSTFDRGALIMKVDKKAYKPEELDAAGYPLKTSRRKETDTPTSVDASTFRKTPKWDDWHERFQRWLEKELA